MLRVFLFVDIKLIAKELTEFAFDLLQSFRPFPPFKLQSLLPNSCGMEQLPLDLLAYTLEFIRREDSPRSVSKRFLAACWRERHELRLSSWSHLELDEESAAATEEYERKLGAHIKQRAEYLRHFQVGSNVRELYLWRAVHARSSERLLQEWRVFLRCLPAVTSLVIFNGTLEALDSEFSARLQSLSIIFSSDAPLPARLADSSALSSLRTLELSVQIIYGSPNPLAAAAMDNTLMSLPLSTLSRLEVLSFGPEHSGAVVDASPIAAASSLTELCVIDTFARPLSIRRLQRLRVLDLSKVVLDSGATWPLVSNDVPMPAVDHLKCSHAHVPSALAAFGSTLTKLEASVQTIKNRRSDERYWLGSLPGASSLRALEVCDYFCDDQASSLDCATQLLALSSQLTHFGFTFNPSESVHGFAQRTVSLAPLGFGRSICIWRSNIPFKSIAAPWELCVCYRRWSDWCFRV